MSAADVTLTLIPSGATIKHVWRTGILKTIKGKEQRSALFTWPRIGVDYSFVKHTSAELNWLKRQLYAYTHGIWAFPIWPDFTTLSSQAASGQKILSVGDTTNRHFYVGRDVILINSNDWTDYEVGTIDTGGLSSTQITLTTNLVSTWNSGYVLPLYDCRLGMKNDLSEVFRNVDRFTLSSIEEYETLRTFTYTLPDSDVDTYEGLDVFDISPMYDLNYSFQHSYDLLQYLGIGTEQTEYDETELFFDMSFRKSSRADIWEILNMFDSKKGRFSKFWVPSNNDDIVVTSAFNAIDTELTIEDIDYDTFWLPNDIAGRYIHIKFPNGTTTQRKITDAPSGTNGITLDSAIGTAVTAGDLDDLKISFLHLVTFATDVIEIKYVGNLSAANIDLSFNGLVEEAIA